MDFADCLLAPGPQAADGGVETVRAPFPKVVRGILRWLAVALLGLLTMLGGLVWDAMAHARDPDLAHQEGSLLSLSRPPHAMLAIGGVIMAASVTAALVRALALSGSRRLSSHRTAAMVVTGVLVAVASATGATRWASSAEVPVATGPLAPSPGPDHHGIGIVSQHAPGPCRATSAQKAAATKLINDTENGTARYRSFANALADGYVGPENPTLTEHYAKVAYTQDGRVLDPTRPEALMYTPTQHGMVLVGVMYMMNVPGEFGPEPGGCLTHWHIHADVCFYTATFAPAGKIQEPGDTCPAGQFRYIPPPLLHVWFVDVPGGRFADEVDAAYLAKKVGP